MDFRASHALQLAHRLRDTTTAFATREAAWGKELKLRHSTVERNHRLATTRADDTLQTGEAGIEKTFRSTLQNIQARQFARLNWVSQAEQNANRQLAQEAIRARDRAKERVQMRHFHSGRNFTAAIERNRRDWAAMQGRLATWEIEATSLRKRAGWMLGGYGGYWLALRQKRRESPKDPGANVTPKELAERIQANLGLVNSDLMVLQKFREARCVVFFPILLQMGLVALLAYFELQRNPSHPMPAVVGLAAGAAVILGALHYFANRRLRSAVDQLAGHVVEVERLLKQAQSVGQSFADSEEQRIEADYTREHADIQVAWDRVDDVEQEYLTKREGKAEAQAARIRKKLRENTEKTIARLTGWREEALAELRMAAESERKSNAGSYEQELGRLQREEAEGWAELERTWKDEVLPLFAEAAALNEAVTRQTPPWDAESVRRWLVPHGFPDFVRFGTLELDLAAIPGALPSDARFEVPNGGKVLIPASLSLPSEASLLIEAGRSGERPAIGTMQNLMLRLLGATRPGKLSFTIIDPVGLGQNFAAFMHLADYEESLINRRIWTQRDQIEERLAELNEHIEKVIQMYLRDEFATIAEYNEEAGTVAEKYHFLVIAGFPHGFSETAAAKLKSILASGPRCGVFPMILWEARSALPEGLRSEDLRAGSVCLVETANGLALGTTQPEPGARLLLNEPPAGELATEFIRSVGKSHIDSTRVEVPFSQVAPPREQRWKLDTTEEVRIAIGRTGATKLQQLALGKGTRQHALFAGKTGSGKSTLFHVIITNLALACSPEQVEFYLIDFKKGVEFKCYAAKRLPHARVVAIESDREFALSALQRVDEELRYRGNLFRQLGVQDLPGYKRAGGSEPIPRTLLVIDEFQEFFVDDDEIAQTASLLLDRLVRQGRAFGIHVLLGSQTLGGAYTLARATLGQMAVRVALQCNEADAYLIMDEENAAPRLLSRPGEAIYNDAAGAVPGNSPFQVVWLPDDERDAWLDEVSRIEQNQEKHYPKPVVFEGNAPADIRENELLERFLKSPAVEAPALPRAWLGAPNAIKGSTETSFARQSGSNLLIVGQRDETALVTLGLSFVALAAQHPEPDARLILVHGVEPGTREAEFIDLLASALPNRLTIAGGRELPALLAELHAELKRRSEASPGESAIESTRVYFAIHGAQRFRKLRNEDEFSFSSSADGTSPGAQFDELVLDGSLHGMHVLASFDTYSNVSRLLSRKAIGEFEMRVLFQMSANDSASLMDSPRASNLGLHRAIFFHESAGTMETFRPYAMPDAEWLEGVARQLTLHGSSAL